MGQEVVHFEENIKSAFHENVKSAFHKNKNPININKVDIKRIELSAKKSNGKDSFKQFIKYRHNRNAFPSSLYVKLPQMNAYAESSKYMNHFEKKNQKNILKYRIKLKVRFKKELDSEPVYNDKYIKTKIKSYNVKVYRNFQHSKIPTDNEYCACLSVILLLILFLLIQTKNIILKYFQKSVNMQ